MLISIIVSKASDAFPSNGCELPAVLAANACEWGRGAVGEWVGVCVRASE